MRVSGQPGPHATTSMKDGEATVADTPRAPVRSPASSTRLAIYYVLIVTEAVSLIGSQISGYAVSIAVFRATGHAHAAGAGGLLLDRSRGPAGRLRRRARRPVRPSRHDADRQPRLHRRQRPVAAELRLGAFRLWHLYAHPRRILVRSRCSGRRSRPPSPCWFRTATVTGPTRSGKMTGSAAGVIAPAVAGMLYALVGVVGSIAIDIATFIAAIVVLAIVRIPGRPETARGPCDAAGVVWRPGVRRLSLYLATAAGAARLLRLRLRVVNFDRQAVDDGAADALCARPAPAVAPSCLAW